MYLEHYGLNEPPFRITPHTEFFYQGANRGATLDALIYAITHGEGLVKVTGEVGSGKTMLGRVLMERLPAHVDTVYLANPSLPREDILRVIAEELKIDLGVAPSAGLTRALQEALVARFAAGRQVVVLIDEAHAMPEASLEEIRLLSNLDHGHHKLLQIVLFGQPELDDILARQHMRQLRERITHSFQLTPLRQTDIREYLLFRLRTAGYKGPTLFSPAAIHKISRESEGLTRRINILADKALISAFSDNRHLVEARDAQAAIRDSGFRANARRARQSHQWLRTAALVVVGLLAGLGIASMILPQRTPPAPAPATLAPAASKITPAASNIPPAAAVAAKPTPPTPAATLAQVIAPTPSSGEDLRRILSTRLIASAQRFANEPEQAATIQLSTLPATGVATVLQQLQRAERQVPAADVYLYQKHSNGRDYGVLYGVFADKASASSALRELPAELKKDKPLLRSIGAIRGESDPALTKSQ